MEEWINLPDAKRLTHRPKVNEFMEGRHMPIPDKVIASFYSNGQTGKSVVQTDLIELGETRKKTLQMRSQFRYWVSTPPARSQKKTF